MDFSLTEEQQLIRNSARDFFKTECPKSVIRELEASETGHFPELWGKMAELGWVGLALPEKYGGAGMTLLDLGVLLEEFGRAAMPGPFFSTVLLGSVPLAEGGSDEQRQQYLPRVASGDLILTVAVWEPEVDSDPKFISAKAVTQGDAYSLSGTKMFVPYAAVADRVLVMARTEGQPGDEKGLTVFLADPKAAGISTTPLQTIGNDRLYEVTLDNVTIGKGDIVGTLNEGLSLVRSTLTKAAALQCAMAVGGAQQELEITADYAKTRHQFQRPIGSFQAVQHRMAEMMIDANAARWVTYQAIWRLSEGMPAERELAIAKAFTDISSQRIALGAQGIHAGVGVDMDHDLQFYFRRQKAYELTCGLAADHLKALESHL